MTRYPLPVIDSYLPLASGHKRRGRKMQASLVTAYSEHAEQAALIKWSREPVTVGMYPQLDKLLAVPNGGHRFSTTAARLKAEGVRAGVPDLYLPVARHGYYGLWIELKRRKGGQVTQAQRWWIEELNAAGYLAVVCRGAQQAQDVLMAYCGPSTSQARALLVGYQGVAMGKTGT